MYPDTKIDIHHDVSCSDIEYCEYTVFCRGSFLVRFGINVMTGNRVYLIHINPRWDEDTLILNTRLEDGEWGEEQVEPLHLARGQDFKLSISLLEDKYQVIFVECCCLIFSILWETSVSRICETTF